MKSTTFFKVYLFTVLVIVAIIATACGGTQDNFKCTITRIEGEFFAEYVPRDSKTIRLWRYDENNVKRFYAFPTERIEMCELIQDE